MSTNTWTADRRLYLDADGNVVEEDDPKRATLLVGKGGTLSMEEAERYGLTGAKASAGPAENKAVQPAENKAETGAEDTIVEEEITAEPDDISPDVLPDVSPDVPPRRKGK